jgi:hypothetical protein
VTFDVEKLYAGVLVGSDDRRRSLNVSLGRQNFTLNDGFLISQYGSQWNAGPRPGVYLAPRTTHDFAALGTLKLDRWTATAFYLDPNEYEPIESDTVLAGFNLRHNFTDRFHVNASVIHAVKSVSRYAAPTGPAGTREGLWTYAAHLRWADPAVAPGLYDMRAGAPSYGKTRPLRVEDFAGFEAGFGPDPLGRAPREDQGEEGRFRRFSREGIRARGDNLDIAWLRDGEEEAEDGLTDPDDITAAILGHLREATREIEALVVELEGDEPEEAPIVAAAE